MRQSLPGMESVDAKLTRAKLHLDAFGHEATRFREAARPKFIRKVDTNRTSHWLVVHSELAFPPIELSTIVGDALFNMRSALDNLICGLVRSQTALDDCARRQFPIFIDEKTYSQKQADYLRGIPDAARKVIERFQPFCRPENAREIDPLWILNTLCNRDKHRALNFTLGYHKDVEVILPLKNGDRWQVELPAPLYVGDVTRVALNCPVDSVDDHVRVGVRGRTILQLRSTDPWADRAVDDLLSTCLEHVLGRVVPSFGHFFR